ncbi:hypothetical protein HY214_00760 [Candidatus Roizmanbacteria bacterium]|nr:hypothetical protein [Candidatus Roizmanbacteria bacterium]
MSDHPVDSFFHGLATIIVIVPIVILISGLAIKLMGFQKEDPKISKVMVTTSPVFSPAVKVSQLDLVGPFYCHVSLEKAASAEIYLKNQNIKASVFSSSSKKNYLFLGDCLHIWKEPDLSGTKMCGLSSIKSMLKFLPLNADVLRAFLPKLGLPVPTGINQDVINNLLESCKKQPIEENIFLPPTQVLFKIRS